ncbi:MAG: hypothetical protein ACI4AQ_03730 [Lachnospiraceae bacterium]
MLELIKSEGKLEYGKGLFQMLLISLGAAVFGAALHALILYLDKSSDITYVYFGTFFTWIAVIFLMLGWAVSMNNRFILLVSMGQKRRNIIGCEMTYLVLFSVAAYLFVLLVYTLESNLYPVIYAGIPLDPEFMAGLISVSDYIFLVILVGAFIFRFMAVMSLKVGNKIYGLFYLIFCGSLILSARLEDGKPLSLAMMNINHWCKSIPAIGWWCAGLIIVLVIHEINALLLKKIDI